MSNRRMPASSKNGQPVRIPAVLASSLKNVPPVDQRIATENALAR